MSKAIIRKKVLSLILAATMGFMAVTQQAPVLTADTAKADSEGKYISEVYTAYGKDESSAENALRDKGYTPVKGNLNKGAKTYVMMGYKTTEDPKNAIRDLAVMSSQGNYSIGEYENVLKKRKKEIAASLKEFMTMVKEYRACYEKKEGKAILAHEMLNNFIEDDSGKRMGDLLLGDTLQDKVGSEESIDAKNEEKLPDLVTIIMQGSAIHINTIQGILGSATDSKKDDLVQRTADTTEDDLEDAAREKKPGLSEVKLRQYIKGQYDTTAKGLAKEAEQLAKDFKKYEKGDLKLENATQKKIDEKFGTDGKIETPKDLYNASKRVEWESTAATYDALKNYEGGKFKKGELLDLIMKADVDKPEKFYTMAASLTKGQKAAKVHVSLRNMLLEAVADGSGNDSADKTAKEDDDKNSNNNTDNNSNDNTDKKIAEEQSKDIKKVKDVSIYDGVDRNVYKTDGSVALTDEALKSKIVPLPVDNSGEAFKTAFAISAGVSWAATLFCFFKYLGKLDTARDDLQFYIDTYRPQIYGRMTLDGTLDNVAKMNVDQMVKEYGSLEKAYQELTKTSTVEGGAAEFYSDMYEQARGFDKKTKEILNSNGILFLKYATIALALISAGLTVAALVYKKEAELPPIPKYIINVSQDKMGNKLVLTYDAADGNGLEYIPKSKNNRGDRADTKAYEGRQWLVLYSTKEETAGEPITTDIVVQEKPDAPSGYKGSLHIIGESGAQDLIKSDFMNFSNFQKLKNKGNVIYMFYSRANSASGAASMFSRGMLAIIAIAGLAVLATLALILRRSRKNAA